MSKRVSNKKSPVRKRKHGLRVVPARSGRVRLSWWKLRRALRIADEMERSWLLRAVEKMRKAREEKKL